MGVKSKRKTHTSPFPAGFLILLLCVVGIPFFLVKACTAQGTPNSATHFSDSSLPEEKAEYSTNEAPEKSPAQVLPTFEKLPASSANRPSTYKRDSKGLYELQGPVLDAAGILSDSEFASLDSYLRAVDLQTGLQIAVLTVPTLQGEDIASFSMRHVEKWGLGQSGTDNGVLLTVSLAERDVRIETGYGAEGTLTDVKCSRIIRNVIVPSFRTGSYGEGITEAVLSMVGILAEDESLISPAVESQNENSGTSSALAIFCLFFAVYLFLMIFAITQSKSTRRRRGFGVVPPIYTNVQRNNFSSSTNTNSTPHHNFHGGGGHFGGGGASGHW